MYIIISPEIAPAFPRIDPTFGTVIPISVVTEITIRLKISPACSLIFPYHQALDLAKEKSKGDNKIGTTGRGIGPAYEDKVARRGLRLVDLFDQKRFAEKLKENCDYYNFLLTQYFHVEPVDFDAILKDYLEYAEILKPLVADIPNLLQQHYQRGDKLLFEGAQGTMLDIDLGTYPFVTSSNTTAGGAAVGSGLGPLQLDYVLGISKAYTTRVGSGPFPTELSCEVGAEIAKRGNEFGSVTGRARRCGWFDAVIAKRAIAINSISALCITKLDVLDGFDEIKLCVGYKLNGELIHHSPFGAEQLSACEPVYETMSGWQESTFGITKYDQLPENAKRYLHRIEEITACKIGIISTGPDREQTIVLEHPFEI